MKWLGDAITLYGPGFTGRLAGLLFAIETGAATNVAFIVPPACGWSLPVYELALMTARRAAASGCSPRLHLVTPEPAPWSLFGEHASSAVADLLDEHGIKLHCATTVTA